MTDHYHHGDLRRAVLDRALEVIAAQGAEALNLRAIAADLGVTHTAPRHHFGIRQGVLTAVAAEGFAELARRLRAPRERGEPFLEVGVAYVRFAMECPAYFQVMFQPALLDDDDEALAAAGEEAFAVMRDGVAELARAGAVEDAAAAVVAGWGLMHGVASLALSGSLDKARVRELIAGGDIIGIARRSGAMLYGSPSTTHRTEPENPDD